jgi:hypothetical protein
MAKRLKRVIRKAAPAERTRQAEIRRQVQTEFPPLTPAREPSVKNRIAAAIRQARKNQGLTWYAVAKRAGIANPNTVRDIEFGRDARLSNVEAVAAALGLKLELLQAS